MTTQGIEAGTDETQSGSAVGETPAPEGVRPVSGTQTHTPSLVELAVTQADREAAADYLIANGMGLVNVMRIRRGRKDSHPATQAFARHRQQSTASLEAEAARLRAALEVMLCESCPPPNYGTDVTRCEPCPRRQALEASNEQG
jgi:hypothetical protein